MGIIQLVIIVGCIHPIIYPMIFPYIHINSMFNLYFAMVEPLLTFHQILTIFHEKSHYIPLCSIKNPTIFHWNSHYIPPYSIIFHAIPIALQWSATGRCPRELGTVGGEMRRLGGASRGVLRDSAEGWTAGSARWGPRWRSDRNMFVEPTEMGIFHGIYSWVMMVKLVYVYLHYALMVGILN